MDILTFVKKAKIQDDRNEFEKNDFIPEIIPNEMKQFYLIANPVDVEIQINDSAIRFFPVNELQQLQEDYSLEKDVFIFATCNSDPIFYKAGKIYSKYHGSLDSQEELCANSFQEYLEKID